MAEKKSDFWERLRSMLNCSCFTEKNTSSEIVLTQPLETSYSRNKSRFNTIGEEDENINMTQR